jgi:hypothetical protein
MQLPAGSVATHAAPVHVAVQLPAPQESSCVCGPSESGQGTGPTIGVASPVVNGSLMSRAVGGESPCGVQSLDSS